MATRGITIEFLGKDKSAGGTAAAVERKFGKLGGTLDRVGQRAGKLLAGGAVLATAALYKMGQAAADDELAQSKLADTLRTGVGATKAQIDAAEAWITTQGKVLGVADDELRPALARLATATGDVSEAQRLAAIAMDVAAARGVSLEQVTMAMEKAQNGSVGGLGRLGIATKDAAGKTLSLEKITAKMARTYKGAAANAAETNAGKQKKLSVAFGELQEQIGTMVIPIMEKLVAVGMNVVDWVSENTTLVLVLAGSLGGLLAGLWAVSAVMRAWALATTAWTAATKIATAVQWLFNAAMSANPIGLIVIGIAALVAGLVIAYKKSETFRKIVNAAFGKVLDAVQFAWKWIKSNWPLLLAILTGPFGIAVAVIAKNWDRIKAGAGTVKDFVVEKFQALISWFRGLPEKITKATAGMWDGIKDAFKGVINWIISAWNDLEFRIPSVDTHIPGVGKVGGFALGTPNIPMLAKGGTIRSAGDVIVGDRGPERLTLPRGATVTPLDRAGTSVVFNINGALDPVATAKQVQTMLLRLKRTNGVDLGLA